MNLARHSITATNPVLILDARFDPDCNIFTTSTPAGFAVFLTKPFNLLRKRGIYRSTVPSLFPISFASRSSRYYRGYTCSRRSVAYIVPTLLNRWRAEPPLSSKQGDSVGRRDRS